MVAHFKVHVRPLLTGPYTLTGSYRDVFAYLVYV